MRSALHCVAYSQSIDLIVVHTWRETDARSARHRLLAHHLGIDLILIELL